MFSVTLLLVSFTLAFASALKPTQFMERLKLGGERFLSASEKRSIPMDDEATCSDARVSELFSELSDSCQNYLFEATAQYEFEEESIIICESCGRSLYSILECLDSGPTELELFDVLCTENESGDTCYSLLSGEGVEEDEIFAECGDMACSDECRRKLQESFDEYGCCLYSLVSLNESADSARDMWAACGIVEPGMCAPAFGDGPDVTLPTLPPVDVEELPSEDDEESVTEDIPSSTTQPPSTETSRETPAKTETSQPASSFPPAVTTAAGEETTTSTPGAGASSDAPTDELGNQGDGVPLLRGAADHLMVDYAFSLLFPVLISAKF